MSVFVALGLSHHTAPLSLRERVAIPADALPSALASLCALPGIEEAALLSTCNRTEIYVAARHADAATAEIRRWLIQMRGLDETEIDGVLYAHSASAAVRHLFRVVSSLDSMVIGETQIAGQAKDAYGIATSTGTAGAMLHRTMQRAFSVAKRVRTETSLGRRAVSMSSVAVDLARHVFGDLDGRRALLVGAGKMSDLAARALRASGCELYVVNRSLDRAIEIARAYDARPRGWEELRDCLLTADLVITATGSQEPVIRPELVSSVVKERQFRSLVFVDIAVPRDVDPRVGAIENVYLFDVDALQKALAHNLAERRRDAQDAEGLVDDEVASFVNWMREQQTVPTVKDLRDHFVRVARAEEERLLRDLGSLTDDDRKKIRFTIDSIVNKLLHAPLVALKSDTTQPVGLADAARRLFDLERSAAATPPAESSPDK